MNQNEQTRLLLSASLNLDEVLTGDEWGTTVGEIIRDELKVIIRSQLREALKKDAKLKKALRAVQDQAVRRVLEAAGDD